MFELVVCVSIVWLMCMGAGCSHAVVVKKCAKVEQTSFRPENESVCDSLWFWE